VSSVEPRGLLCGYKELRSVGVFTSVCHGQPASTKMLELKVFVGKSLTVNGATPSAYIQMNGCLLKIHGFSWTALATISFGEVTSLKHEVFNDTMKLRPLVTLSNNL